MQMSTICLFPIGWRSFHVSLSLILKRLWSWLGADVYHMLVSYWMALFSCQSEFDTEEVMELAGADVYAYACFLLDGALFMSV